MVEANIVIIDNREFVKLPVKPIKEPMFDHICKCGHWKYHHEHTLWEMFGLNIRGFRYGILVMLMTYETIAHGKYPINAEATKWREWEIRKYPNKFQLMLVMARLENETEYCSCGLTWSMIRAFLIQMGKYYGIERMEQELGIQMIVKDPVKWGKMLRDKAQTTLDATWG
jgi:hypothetical protein